jgi:hypothetical protein
MQKGLVSDVTFVVSRACEYRFSRGIGWIEVACIFPLNEMYFSCKGSVVWR